ncbi:TadE/TadG family type IV pilus assembly protein [Achromobacter insolitus]|uniref:TadE/TadG family type IV pilus assembly protein n=1 Tax=Achromobacter insolitus TaxID=217204 RepID=UPI000A65E180|nr:TadE family protein [Achromobacter insolitus]AVG40379.1 pilus assembly protein [Achromobacter insolitus]
MRASPQLRRGRPLRARQRGIAALEFSLTLTMLLLFICGVVGFGALFWMQQQLAAAAADGARAAVYARFNGQADVPAAACLAAMGTFSAGSAVLCSTTRAPCAWTGAGGRQADCATVAMTYTTQSWPLLETVRGLITALPGTNRNWIPSRLYSQAIVQISQGTP